VQNAIRQTSTVRFDYNSAIPETWAPTLSTITVQIQPVYSRDTVKNFNMSDFVKGKLSNFGSDGKNPEGIGFI
jgi:hypothetical protein